MQCPKCDQSLRIGVSFITFTGDHEPNQETKAFTNLPMICINPECLSYGGNDLSKPKQIVETIVSQLN